MAFCMLEFDTVNDATGEPQFPPIKRTAAQAFNASVALDASTRYVLITPDANMRLRLSWDGAAAAAGDPQILANENRGFYVKETNGIVYAYGISG